MSMSIEELDAAITALQDTLANSDEVPADHPMVTSLRSLRKQRDKLLSVYMSSCDYFGNGVEWVVVDDAHALQEVATYLEDGYRYIHVSKVPLGTRI